MSDYTSHLADHKRPLYTACGEPWQGWQAPENPDPQAIELAPHVPPKPYNDRIRLCQACAKVTAALPPRGR